MLWRFCETPTRASPSDTDLLQQSQDWDGTVPEQDCLKTAVIRSITLSLSSRACCNLVRLVGTDIAITCCRTKPKGKYEADLRNCCQEQQIPVDLLQLSPDDAGRVSGTMRHNPDAAFLEYQRSVFSKRSATRFSRRSSLFRNRRHPGSRAFGKRGKCSGRTLSRIWSALIQPWFLNENQKKKRLCGQPDSRQIFPRWTYRV